ncbi:MAG: hypothetical protein JW841_11045 [Deltaproteobacteria bacterium]|nr:hypothetical protein [Deltaproteobacteria bacterium]
MGLVPTYLASYTGVLFGHLLAGAILVAALYAFNSKQWLLSGFLIGLALLTEYTCGLALPIWVVAVGFRERRWSPIVAMIGGVIPSGIILAVYNTQVFGNPVAMSYSFVSDPSFVAMKDSFGFGWPKISNLRRLLFGEFRGLALYGTGYLVLVFIWIVRTFRDAIHNNQYYFFLQIAKSPAAMFGIAMWLVNGSYYMWYGGSCFGPRHLIPCVAIGLVAAARWLPDIGKIRTCITVSFVFGFALSAINKVTMSYRLPSARPLQEDMLPRLLAGRFNEENMLTNLIGLKPAVAAILWSILIVCTGLWSIIVYNQCQVLKKYKLYEMQKDMK